MANQVPYTATEDSDKTLKKYIRLFEISWKEARDYFTRANEDIAQYEQDIDLNSWPTLSEITLGEAKKFVDQSVPTLMSYIFGDDNPFVIIPADKKIDYTTARKIRDFILYNMRVNMRIETNGFLTIKDAVKLGKGYGIVEPKIVTPPISEEQIVITGNERLTNRVMEIGKPELVPSYSYLSFGSVIPTPDGANPDEVSCVFVLRMYQEETFRKMFDKRLNPDTPFEGNVEKIIEYSRQRIFNGYLSTPRQIAAQIANQNRAPYDMMNEAGSNTPVIIPVLQCYARDEHVWFAADKFKIYHVKSKYQTLRCPVVAATFEPDGIEWFTPGIIRPRRRMIMGVETFYNALMDLMTMVLHPHQIINRDALLGEGENTDLQPYGKTHISGSYKAGDVITWAQLPPLPAVLFEVGNKLEEFDASSAGQPRALQGQGTPGLVRGGSGAMESLLQTSTGRDKLSAKHIENGWYTSVVENTLILCQMLAKDNDFMPRLQYNPEDKGDKLEYVEITKDDIRRVYRIQLSFTEKMRNEMAEATIRSMKYDRIIENEKINREEAIAYLIGNDKDYNRLTSGVNVQENIAAMQAMAAAQRRPAGGTATPEQPIPGGAGTAMGGLET